MALDPTRLTPRAWESDLIDWRGYRIQSTQNWKMRLKSVDRMYRGDWAEVFPNESVMTENPYVMNLVQSGMDDIAKLVSEAVATVDFPPAKESATAKSEALVRKAIANTHWSVNDGDMLAPKLSMDLSGAGAVFVSVYNDGESEYPCYHRHNPRFCYPDTLNGKLLDLMVLEDLNIRTAARLFPHLGLDKDPTITNQIVELMHYYSPDGCIQAVVVKQTGNRESLLTVKRWMPVDKDGEPYMPVAFGMLDTYDGAFRGIFDQVLGSLMMKNRLIKQAGDYADQLIYAPWEEAGIMNPEAFASVGPETVFHRDPNVQGGGARRIPPAGNLPELLQYIEFLDQEQRGGTTQPASRQGEVQQSIASAAFVSSTQGALTSAVRNEQRIIADVRSQLTTIGMKMEESEMDTRKALLYPIGNKNTYLPSTDIQGMYRNKVQYGAGAGLDRQQADVRIGGHVGGGLVSHRTARTQIDYITDPDAEEAQIELEQSVSIAQQKLLAAEDPMLIMKVIALQKEGMTFLDAVVKVVGEQPSPAPVGAPPGPEPTPETAGQSAESMAAGGAPPGQPGPQVPITTPFTPPAISNVSVPLAPSPARPLQERGP